MSGSTTGSRTTGPTRSGWCASLIGSVATLALLGACGTASGPTDRAEPADPTGLADFCAGASHLVDGTVLDGIDLTSLEAPAAGDPSLDAAVAAVAALEAVTAPQEIAEQWRAVVAPLADLVETFRDADVTTQEGADELRARTDALVEPAVAEAGEAVDAYVAEHC